jgi:hypothetical protein
LGKLRDVSARDDIFAVMGDGNDVLDLDYVGGDEVVLDGGAGFDSLKQRNNAPRRLTSLRHLEWINGVNQPAVGNVTSPIISRLHDDNEPDPKQTGVTHTQVLFEPFLLSSVQCPITAPNDGPNPGVRYTVASSWEGNF